MMGLSREEDILESMISGGTYDSAPMSRIEALLIYIAREGLKSFDIEVCPEGLPETGEDYTIYLVPADVQEAGNIYSEYLWVNNQFEFLGSANIDISQFATKEDLLKESLNLCTRTTVFETDPSTGETNRITSTDAEKKIQTVTTFTESSSGLTITEVTTSLDETKPFTITKTTVIDSSSGNIVESYSIA